MVAVCKNPMFEVVVNIRSTVHSYERWGTFKREWIFSHNSVMASLGPSMINVISDALVSSNVEGGGSLRHSCGTPVVISIMMFLS